MIANVLILIACDAFRFQFFDEWGKKLKYIRVYFSFLILKR